MHCPSARQPLLLALALGLGLGTITAAATAPRALAGGRPVPPPPTTEELRQMQRLVQACGRDNSASSCDQARRQVDPLLDHPRLSAACKDTVWQVLQRARPVAVNDFRRREAINQSALELTQFCRPRPAAAAPASSPPANSGPAGNAPGDSGR